MGIVTCNFICYFLVNKDYVEMKMYEKLGRISNNSNNSNNGNSNSNSKLNGCI